MQTNGAKAQSWLAFRSSCGGLCAIPAEAAEMAMERLPRIVSSPLFPAPALGVCLVNGRLAPVCLVEDLLRRPRAAAGATPPPQTPAIAARARGMLWIFPASAFGEIAEAEPRAPARGFLPRGALGFVESGGELALALDLEELLRP